MHDSEYALPPGYLDRLADRLSLDDPQREAVRRQLLLLAGIKAQQGESIPQALAIVDRVAEALASHAGSRFEPRVTRFALSGGWDLTCIEPPCGSDAWVLRRENALLFVDCGFGFYEEEMRALLRRIFPGFDGMERRLALTHPDWDHCGLMHWFDEIFVTRDTLRHFRLEAEGLPDFREQNPLQAPYVRMTRIFSRGKLPRMETLVPMEGAPDDGAPVCFAGSLEFHGRRLDIYRGNGGHAAGECAFVDERDRLVFSGDILLNLEGCIPPQAAYNRLAPYLMSGVNLDPRKAVLERVALKRRFPPDRYRFCTGHGAILEPPGGELPRLPLAIGKD